MPVEDHFWGDRYGKVADPFGHEWQIATHKVDLTPEEITERGKKAMAAMSWSRLRAVGVPPTAPAVLARGLRDDAGRVVATEHVGVDDEVVLRRNLCADAVEALEIIGALGIPFPDRTLRFRLVDSSLRGDPLHSRFRRRGHEHPEQVIFSRECKGRGMGADDDGSGVGRSLDRVTDEGAQLVAPWWLRFDRGGWSSSHGHRSCAGFAQLIQHAPDQRLPMFDVGHRRWADTGSARRVRDDVLADVRKLEPTRDEPRNLVAAGAVRARDTDDGSGHAADVTPSSWGGQPPW